MLGQWYISGFFFKCPTVQAVQINSTSFVCEWCFSFPVGTNLFRKPNFHGKVNAGRALEKKYVFWHCCCNPNSDKTNAFLSVSVPLTEGFPTDSVDHRSFYIFLVFHWYYCHWNCYLWLFPYVQLNSLRVLAVHLCIIQKKTEETYKTSRYKITSLSTSNNVPITTYDNWSIFILFHPSSLSCGGENWISIFQNHRALPGVLIRHKVMNFKVIYF